MFPENNFSEGSFFFRLRAKPHRGKYEFDKIAASEKVSPHYGHVTWRYMNPPFSLHFYFLKMEKSREGVKSALINRWLRGRLV